MGKKVARLGIVKDSGYLYYLDKQGNVSRSKMKRKDQTKKSKPELIHTLEYVRESGFLYYLDKDGDLAAAKMGAR